jgi:broad specificity phosphatase PhoE
MSPLRRAAETCELAGFGDVAEPCDDLMEWDYGEYEGRTTAEIRDDVPGWTVWDHAPPGGESAADVGRRTDRVISLLEGTEGDAALFAHGHVLRVLAARWLGLPADAGRYFKFDTARFGVLGYEHETRVVSAWNHGGAEG